MHLLHMSLVGVPRPAHGGEGDAHGEEGHGEDDDVDAYVDVDPHGRHAVAEEGGGDGEGDEEAEDYGADGSVGDPGGFVRLGL
mmetsp:Transcript_9592/g.20742  ORF Transcript_9592/g.20742 Transcript_9592/m.20742 type:complete len:83 (+) Transcript_9592:685-933(+)